MFDSGNSPDLNPQENVWIHTKRKVYENGGFATEAALRRRVERVWRETSTDYLRDLAHSMVKRCRLLRLHPERKLPY